MEYIVIDLEKMRCVAKAQTLDTATDLAFLMLPRNIRSTVHPFDVPRMFSGYTQLELTLLLKNTCGNDYSKLNISQLQVICCYVFQKMEGANPSWRSLAAQVNWKEKVCKEQNLYYNFVEGAIKPQLADDGCLFLTTEPLPNVQDIAKDWYKLKQELENSSLQALQVTPLHVAGANVPVTPKTSQVRENTAKTAPEKPPIVLAIPRPWEVNKK